jgi:hypothetical protein
MCVWWGRCWGSLHILGKYFTTELHPQSKLFYLIMTYIECIKYMNLTCSAKWIFSFIRHPLNYNPNQPRMFPGPLALWKFPQDWTHCTPLSHLGTTILTIITSCFCLFLNFMHMYFVSDCFSHVFKTHLDCVSPITHSFSTHSQSTYHQKELWYALIAVNLPTL